MNTLKFGNGEWYGKKDTILAYNDLNSNYKPLPFNFSRASKATVINKDGLIEEVGSGQPRVDYKDDSKGAMLLEPSRINALNFSEPTSSETIADGITYESFNWNLGFTNCIKFGDNSQTRYRYFTGTIANSTQYTISAFVIMDDLSEPVLGTASNNGDFILRLGGVTATTGNLPNVNMGNNIYRVSSLITSGSSGGTTGLLKYSNQSNKGFRIVGFQVEQGTYPTSYIPTQGSAVTRLQDKCLKDDFSILTVGNSYTLFFDVDLNEKDNNKTFFNIENSSGSTSFTVRSVLGGVIRVYNNLDLQYPTNNLGSSTNKWVVRIDGTSFKIFGAEGSLSGTLTTARDMGEGIFGRYTQTKINDFKVYNTALSDSESEALVN